MAQAYVPTAWIAGAAPAITAQRLNNIETGLSLASAPIVTALPAGAVDGQECNFLADATNGVVWHLVYRASEAGGYKWYFTGGGALTSESAGPVSTNSGAYVGIASDPTVVLPLAGDYMIGLGAQVFSDTANAGAVLTAKLGAAAASDNESLTHISATANAQGTPAKQMRRNGLASGASIATNHRTLGVGTANYIRRWLEVQPVRVG